MATTFTHKFGNVYLFPEVDAGEVVACTFDRPVKTIKVLDYTCLYITESTHATGARLNKDVSYTFANDKGYPDTIYFGSSDAEVTAIPEIVVEEYGDATNNNYFTLTT